MDGFRADMPASTKEFLDRLETELIDIEQNHILKMLENTRGLRQQIMDIRKQWTCPWTVLTEKQAELLLIKRDKNKKARIWRHYQDPPSTYVIDEK